VSKKLGKDFYLQEDVVSVTKQLLGKRLCTRIDGALTSAIITEAEAYAGVTDRASHAYGGRFTERTKVMYMEGGLAYVYLCYGIHHLFNVVTNREGVPHAVLIRAAYPEKGLEWMLFRRNKKTADKTLSAGPGTVSQALGIHTSHTGTDLLGKTIWIEDAGITIKAKDIIAGPRVGVDYAGKDALLPYRFIVRPEVVGKF